MSTIAAIRIPAEEFALAETLSRVSGVGFETVRVVAQDDDRVLPLVWAQTSDEDALERALADDPSVENEQLLADLAGERLYRMDWVANIETVVYALLEHDGTVLSASGRKDGWHLRILFPDRNSLSATHEFATDNGVTISLERVTDLNEGRGSQFSLTERQHQALLAAYERGYYEVPQEVTMEELADEFGVSAQAVSQRLHRAYRNLIENALVIGRPTDTVEE
ncbi:helix-turn-helix domain-containing protein [Halococcus agarilyticus]|uniref:helix-turn-helix domain-containing protein n=1 Tax=Halococcus agarilyticus TaxID=1232219 RepID=UPI0006776866|nr:helix-turn-helix domain-containing protein [Halococcus agarilyticus]